MAVTVTLLLLPILAEVSVLELPVPVKVTVGDVVHTTVPEVFVSLPSK